MISGNTLMMIIKAAKTDGVIFTTSEERAKTLRVFAEEVCNFVFAFICKETSFFFYGGDNLGIIKSVEEHHKRNAYHPDEKACDY
jgi:hypothetical protein